MKKKELIYICNNCSEEFSKWTGVCPSCKAWNTLREIKIDNNFNFGDYKEIKIEKLSNINAKKFIRIKTNINEFDRALGGGLVSGSLILLGGDPGIGKSTLTAQLIKNIENSIYVSGEESIEQIKLRMQRLGILSEEIRVISDTNINAIVKAVTLAGPKFVVIDSIQTMYSSEYPSTPGSLVQVRECALKLMKLAKEKNICIILVGHVTKDGIVAGPKILEHLVDVVLYLEGERYQNNRILRTVKNRFGSIDEIGIFNMTGNGLIEVSNPSEIFLDQSVSHISGSSIAVSIEGNRPIFIEIQALTTKSFFGYPKRTVSGYDLNRLNLMIAILSKRCKLHLEKYDIFLNIIGGFKVKDPGVDLAVCLAIASAYFDKKIPNKYVFFGEVGLSGEIRKVRFHDKRLKEIDRLGYKYNIKSKYLIDLLKNIFKIN